MKKNWIIAGIFFLALLSAAATLTLVKGPSKNSGDAGYGSTIPGVSGDVQAPTSIRVRVTPMKDTKITINDKTVGRNEVIALNPGSYTVTASRKGFATQSRTVTLQENDKVVAGLVLLSNSDDTKNWYETHPEDAAEAEGIAGLQSRSTAESKIQTLPFLSRLPREIKDHYKMTYDQSTSKPDDPSAVTITIMYKTEADKQAANNWIRYQGYEPSKLDIKYVQNAGPWQR